MLFMVFKIFKVPQNTQVGEIMNIVQEKKCTEGYLVNSCFKIKPPIHNTFGNDETEIKHIHQKQPPHVSFAATGFYLLNYLNCDQYVYFTIAR